MSDHRFRIVSLDGGGLRGLFTASFVDHVERHSDVSFAENSDLIVGTSTGAIIALGLASGMPASEILTFYQKIGPLIFNQQRGRLRRLFSPKYSNGPLVQALREVFDDRTLDDLNVPVCIPSYELSEGIPRVFKDNHSPLLHWGGNLPIWKVAAASAAAPLYLPAVSVDSHDHHIDGGIWANNPILVSITEAIKYFDQPLENIVALSIGTGSHPPRISQKDSRNLGELGWVRGQRIINVLFDAQSRSADYVARLILRPEQFLRVDVDLDRPIPLDSFSAAEPLIERGRQQGRVYRNQVVALMLD